jgi:hypothetical protein
LGIWIRDSRVGARCVWYSSTFISISLSPESHASGTKLKIAKRRRSMGLLPPNARGRRGGRATSQAGRVRPRRPTGRLSGFVVIRDLSYTCTTKPRTTSRTGRDAPPPEWVREARAKGGGEGRLADSSERGRSMGEWAKASAGNHDRAPCYSRPGWVQVAMARRRRQ